MDEAGEVVDDLDVGRPLDGGRFLRVRLEIVDAADAVQHVETQLRLVAQPAADLRQRAAETSIHGSMAWRSAPLRAGPNRAASRSMNFADVHQGCTTFQLAAIPGLGRPRGRRRGPN